MKLRLRFFAILRERVGRGEAEHETATAETVGELWNELCDRYPELRELGGSMAFAVNREYVDRQYRLGDGDEVALIPPVSGG